MDALKAAFALVQAGRVREAAAALEAADDETKASSGWSLARGTVALKLGELARAVTLYERAVELEPEVPEVLANLGGALLEQAKAGDAAALRRALEVLTPCCAMGPRLPDAHTNLGMAKLLSGDPEGALGSFAQALQLDPRHVPALYDRAAALNALGRHAECLKALDATLAVDPKFAPALESRKNTLAKLRGS